MDETNNLAPRERSVANSSESLQQRSPFLALDLMPREPHLLDYLLILRKHQWLITFFLLAVVAIVAIATFRMQPIYEATARVEVDRDTPNAFRFNEGDQGEDFGDLEDYIVTQSKILQSETLAMQTVRSMGLDHLPQFGGRPGKPEKIAPPGSDASLMRPPALGAFLGGLSIKRVPNSRLLDVTFEAADPALAARVVNAHLNNFIEQNFRSRFEAATQASNWMAGQLNEMKIKVENAEDARLEYERQNQIWTIDEKSDISTEKLGELEKQLTEAQGDRITKEAVYQLAQSGNYDAIAAVRESVVIQDILKQQTALSSQYTDAVAQYGPKFPKVLRIQAQLKDLPQAVAAVPELRQRAAEDVRRIELQPAVHFVGGGPARASAYEGALKLREACHLVTAEGHDADGILHGPLVSIQPGQTVVAIAEPGPALQRTREVIQALGEIGATVIEVGSATDGYKTAEFDEVLAPIVNVVPLQLLAYEASRRLGVDADSFRRDEPPYAAAQAGFTL